MYRWKSLNPAECDTDDKCLSHFVCLINTDGIFVVFCVFQEKSASSNARLKSNKEIPGLVHQPRANMHISESQQEFFRMLDEKIEKGRDYCSEEEDVT